jgi:hypothetical protein
LHPSSENPVSKFAFKWVNLYRYIKKGKEAAPKSPYLKNKAGKIAVGLCTMNSFDP